MCTRICRSSGQATFEYLLLLLISLTLILGVIWKFNDAFHTYAQQLFSPNEGGYLFCLIENAVLPGDETCQDSFPKFNYANGKTKTVAPIEAVHSNASTSSNSNNPSSSSSNPTASKNNSSKNSASSGGGGGSGPSENRSRNISATSKDFPWLKSGSNGAGVGPEGGGGSGKNGAKGSAGTEVSGISEGDESSSSASFVRGPVFVPVGKGGGGKSQVTQTIPTNDRDLKTVREIAAEKAKKKALEDEDSGFTFGNFLKWIIIIAILVIIVFFVGSQFIAVSRGGKRR